MRWFNDNSLCIGNTPLVRLNRVATCVHATILNGAVDVLVSGVG